MVQSCDRAQIAVTGWSQDNGGPSAEGICFGALDTDVITSDISLYVVVPQSQEFVALQKPKNAVTMAA